MSDLQKVDSIIFTTAVIVVLMLFMPVLNNYQAFIIHEISHQSNDPTEHIEPPEEDVVLQQRLNILLLGDDGRDGETHTRTDTIMLVSLDQKTNQVAVLSIPRDTRVKLPTRGYDRINAAHFYGDVGMAVETVEELLDIKIDYYVHTNFEGFKDIIDTLGGVNIHVEQNMYYSHEGINLKKGQQRLDGDKALQFVRYRHYPLGDITRISQQQKLITALVEEILQVSTITKMPKLLPQLESAIDTNFNMSDTLLLIKLAKQLAAADINILTTTLPGSFQNIDGIDYWQVSTEDAQRTVRELFLGNNSAQIVLPPTKS